MTGHDLTTAPDAMEKPVLAFAQIGDLHLTTERERNYLDLLAIAAQLETQCGSALDFVLLPGDNADNGLPEQYALASTALRMLSRPVQAIPGDHDMEQGGLEAFHRDLGAKALPRAETIRGVRCLFLDASGLGAGGPDFRLGEDQLGWLDAQLSDAKVRGEPAALAIHVYPADLKGEGETEALNALLARHDVALVAMGHTHYNEIANDGRTVFAATRSTGQIEEGPPGYAVITLDAGTVGWRFKALDDPFPFVAITTPADHRLVRDDGPRVRGPTRVRALVLGREAVESVACRVDGGAWVAMARDPDGRTWSVSLGLPAAALVSLTVRALGPGGRPAEHRIVAAGPGYGPPPRHRDGSDADAVGAWPENGIFGTQLGPNRNGRHW